MKRDLELIRKILIAIKKNQALVDSSLKKELLGFSNVDDEIFLDHVSLLSEAGLLTIKNAHEGFRDFRFPTHLTLSGCDFLDHIQNKIVWARLLVLDSKKSSSMDLILMVPLALFYFKNLKSLT